MVTVHIITSLDGGGAEGALYRLVKQTHPNLTQHVICLSTDGKFGPLLRELGVQVHALEMPKGRISLKGLRTLITLLRQKDRTQTVVQTWMYHADFLGGLIARLVGHRNIVWGIRNTKIDKQARKTLAVAKLCAMLSRIVPLGIISCSATAAEYHKQLGYRGRMHLIPNGYWTDKFKVSKNQRQQVRAELGIENNFVLGFVARWDPAKDHATLLQAIRLLVRNNSDIRLVLIGHGCKNSNEELTELIHENELEKYILLLGERSDIPAIMNALDIHVLSSKTEAFPNVVAEAMACGTPCVVTDVGDAAEIIGDCGWVTAPESPQKLSNTIATAISELKDPATKTSKSIECRNRIQENYSMEKMADSFIQVWTSVLKR